MLLDLDGEKFVLESGFWIKFEVKKVPTSAQIPHGIRYSLTLHNRMNKRLAGYDNAHSIKPRPGKRGAKTTARDHRHFNQSVFAYRYENAGRLLEDFFNDVNLILDQNSRLQK